MFTTQSGVVNNTFTTPKARQRERRRKGALNKILNKQNESFLLSFNAQIITRVILKSPSFKKRDTERINEDLVNRKIRVVACINSSRQRELAEPQMMSTSGQDKQEKQVCFL